MAKGYAVGSKEASAVLPTRALLSEELDRVVREGARHMRAAMLEAEVDDFLQRTRYQRGDKGAAIATGMRPSGRSGSASARSRFASRG